MIALQALHEGRHQRPVEERILAVTFLGAAPADVATQVGVGRAHHQAAAPEALALRHVARLVALDGGDLVDEVGVPGLAQANRLRERRRRHGRRSAPAAWPAHGQPVQTFDVARPPHAQARHVGDRSQAVDFLTDRHQRQEVVDARFCGQVGVGERVPTGWVAPDGEGVAVGFQLEDERALVRRVVGMMQRQHRRSVETMENHPVPAVIHEERALVLRPRPVDAARLGDRHKLRVAEPTQRRPQHEQLAAGHPVDERPVGDVALHTGARPGRIAALEERDRLAFDGREVGRETHQIDRAVADLHPFVAVNHVRDAVLHPERAVEDHQLGRGVRGVAEGAIWPQERVGDEHLRAAFDELRPPGRDLALRQRRACGQGVVGVEGDEEVVFAVIAVQFGRPDWPLRPEIGRRLEDDRWAGPRLQVAAGVETDGGPAFRAGRQRRDQVIRLRGRVRHDKRVADAQIRQRVRLVRISHQFLHENGKWQMANFHPTAGEPPVDEELYTDFTDATDV